MCFVNKEMWMWLSKGVVLWVQKHSKKSKVLAHHTSFEYVAMAAAGATKFPTRLTNGTYGVHGVLLTGSQVRYCHVRGGSDSGFFIDLCTGEIHMDSLHLHGSRLDATPSELNALHKHEATGVEAHKAVVFTEEGEVPGVLCTAAQPNISSLGTQHAALDMGDHSVCRVGTPIHATDAATKGYVDEQFGACEFVDDTLDSSTGALTLRPTTTIPRLVIPAPAAVTFEEAAAVHTPVEADGVVTVDASIGRVPVVLNLRRNHDTMITVRCAACTATSLVFVQAMGERAHYLSCATTAVAAGSFTIQCLNVHNKRLAFAGSLLFRVWVPAAAS